MKREALRKRKGFTLIELVIVIVIIGVLAGIAALSYANVTQSSKDGVAKSNLRAIKSAVTVYQADHQGLLPKPVGNIAGTANTAAAKGIDNFKDYLDKDVYEKPGNGYTYEVKNGSGGLELTVVGGGLGTAGDEAKGTKYVIKGTVTP